MSKDFETKINIADPRDSRISRMTREWWQRRYGYEDDIDWNKLTDNPNKSDHSNHLEIRDLTYRDALMENGLVLEGGIENPLSDIEFTNHLTGEKIVVRTNPQTVVYIDDNNILSIETYYRPVPEPALSKLKYRINITKTGWLVWEPYKQ